jgi:hypothetical protein
LAAASNSRNGTSTEDLRQAMWHYRALFEELVESTETDGSTYSQRASFEERNVQ